MRPIIASFHALSARKTMQRERPFGFTLVELAITLAILVILATLVAPSFADLIEKSRLRGATDAIATLLDAARIRSLKTQRQINVSVQQSAWCAGAVAQAGPAAIGAAMKLANTPCDCSAGANCTVPSDAATGAGETMVVSSNAYSGVTLASVSGDIAYSGASGSGGGIAFNPKLGAATDPQGNILATAPAIVVLSKSGKYSTQITVSPLGQAMICVPTTSPFIAGYPSC
jgi:prepilin-type N-terminal cleavage/methylation domain-containing protein